MKSKLEEIWNGPLQQALRINAWEYSLECNFPECPVLIAAEEEEEQVDDDDE